MSLARRTLLGLIATCIVAMLLSLLLGQRDPAAVTASQLTGQRWYELSLGDRKIGYYSSLVEQQRDGSYRFATELRFALTDEGAVRVQDSYRFAATAPHALVEATHNLRRDGGELSVAVNGGPVEYQAVIERNGDQTSKAVSWRFGLADYLAVEQWLENSTPSVGQRITTTSADLATLTLKREVFELTARTALGYELRNPALLDDTRIQLNRQLLPERFQVAGVFDLQQTSKTQALTTPEPLAAVSYQARLDQPLRRITQLTRLALQATGPDQQKLDLPNPLVLRSNPVIPAGAANYLQPTLEYPSDHPRVQRLVRDLGYADPASSTDAARARVGALVSYVHRFIRYESGTQHLPVLEILRERRGDCTEYADLFTSLARAAGIPARTITGMAYSDEDGPALAFHAWNQVKLGDQWLAVDPTWDQMQVDATHWPLPADERTALLLLTGQVQLAFAVVATEYDDDLRP